MKVIAPPLAVLACLLTAAGCASSSARHGPPLRRDSTLFLEARRADALGLTPTAAFATSFLSTPDVARALGGEGKGTPAVEGKTTGDPDEAWFETVLESHRDEIDDAWDDTSNGSTFIGLAEDPRFRMVYVDQTVSSYNDQGRELSEGFNLFVSNRFVARIANSVVLTADPELYFNEQNNDSGDGSDAGLRMQELSLSARLGPAEVTVGRTPLWWGPGRHGALLLSNNAQPLDLIKVGTGGPLLLPGPLAHLGLLRFEAFASRLEDARTVPHPYLAGARLTSRLLPWLELGVSRTAMFGGKGRRVDENTVWNVITAQTENDATNDPGNQLASVDGRLIVPWSVQPFEIYGELGGEDEAGGFFSHTAYLAGLYLPRVGPWHFLELTLEVADTTVTGKERVWYTNRNFPDGYTYKEHTLGHHVGTDGLDLFAEARVHASADWNIFGSFDFEEHFRQDPVQEKLYQARVGAEWRAWKGLRVAAFLEYDWWNNFRQANGVQESGHAIGTMFRWDF